MRRVNCSILVMEPFGEIGANFSLQLSSRTQFAKISNKKLSQKINVKNIKTRVKIDMIEDIYSIFWNEYNIYFVE